ncbi:MAG: ankyrin repeat domain-containing protein [Endozoicomonas sp.]
MLQAPKMLFWVAIFLFATPALSWPPSEEDRKKWFELIEQGNQKALEAFINKLRAEGEDIAQWSNMDIRNLSKKYIYKRPLQLAASTGKVEIAQLLLDNGAILNGDWLGYTPVHQAVHSNQPEMLTFLLSQGAQIDGDNPESATPLSAAIGANHEGMTSTLLSYGASVHPRPPASPLNEAARVGNTAIIQELLIRGADPNGDSEISYSRPLEYAASAGKLAAVKALMAAGAKVNLQDYLQDTPLSSAAEHGHFSVVKYLIEHDANLEGFDLDAPPLTDQELLDRGRVRGILVDDGDFQFVAGTPLNRAACNGHLDIVRLLLESGADVGRVMPCGWAALQQIHSDTGGINDHFFQYQPKNLMFYIPKTLSEEISFSDWLNIQFQSMASDRRAAIAPPTTPLLNLAVVITTLDLPESIDFRYQNGDKITRIESFFISDDFLKITEKKDRANANHLKILFTDTKGERSPYIYYKGDPNHWMREMETTSLLGSRVDDSAYYPAIKPYMMEFPGPQRHPGINAPFLWEGERDNYLYMEWHRPVLARLMLAALEDNPEIKEWATREREIKGVQLYCLGCADGKDMRVFHRALYEQGIESKTVGIDAEHSISQFGIQALYRDPVMGKSKIPPMVATSTVQDFIPRWRKVKKHYDDPVIVVAEDFFGRTILPGPYTALQILQQLIQPETAEMVIIGGLHHPLISERIARAVGWSVRQVDLYHSKAVSGFKNPPNIGSPNRDYTPAFVLTHRKPNEQMKQVYERSLSRSVSLTSSYPLPFRTLDLSMFGLTNQALEYFLNHDEFYKITQIDLSYSYLEEGQLNRTVSLLMGFPALKFVVASGFEPWYSSFVKAMEIQGRLKVVQRKDNKYQHELPSLDPATAKLLGHYKTTPNRLVYAPPMGRTSESKTSIYEQQEQATGFLQSHLIPHYHQQLLQVLSVHNLQLQETPADNLCFFNAAAQQLDLSTPDLQAILINYLQFNQAALEVAFPAFAGEQFHQLIAELQQGQWGHAGLAQLLSWIFNRRVIVLYFHSQTGQVAVQVYNPDGSGSESLSTEEESGLPDNINDHDIILVHNGLGHWLAAFGATPDINLLGHNQALLSPAEPELPLAQQLAQQLYLNIAPKLYSTDIIPKLLALLLLAWRANFK